MSEEIEEEAPADVSEEESETELTLEERQDALKRARWNVFLYLGIAALLFAFALYPFLSTSMKIEEESNGLSEQEITVWGLPVDGEDFTDIPVEIKISVKSLPPTAKYIEVLMIENSKGCPTDGSIEKMTTTLREGEAEYPNNYEKIENPIESKIYEIEMNVDPGIYCLRIVVFDDGDFSGINVDAEVNLYPTQLPLAIFGVLSLLMSGFAFIGAQKHGKYVKSLIEPKSEPSLENAVLAQTSAERIAAGPSGPPTGPTGPPSGPTGPPPAAGPTGPPPAAGPTGPPSQPDATSEPALETTQVPEESAAEPATTGDVYEDQGSGWYFRKFPDGTYDQQVYVIKDGFYVPYEDPNA